MKGKLEDFINKHSEELDHRTPNPDVLDRIMQQMGAQMPQETKTEEKRGIVISFTTMRWAAAACVLLAISFGLWKYQGTPTQDQNNIASQSPRKVQPLSPLHDADTANSSTEAIAAYKAPVEQHRFDDVDRDIEQRRNRIAQSMQGVSSASYKKVLFDKLNDDESPATRIKALSQANRLKNMSNDVVDVLVETMNNDANTNVRMAALDGLARFYKEKYVRKELVKSLKKQKDPTVQIALIELLTRMKESAILSELEGLVKDENNMDAVRETAYTGMYQLRSM